jgi:hypothetical protein
MLKINSLHSAVRMFLTYFNTITNMQFKCVILWAEQIAVMWSYRRESKNTRCCTAKGHWHGGAQRNYVQCSSTLGAPIQVIHVKFGGLAPALRTEMAFVYFINMLSTLNQRAALALQLGVLREDLLRL